MEPLRLQVLQHLPGILETVFRKLIIALPVYIKPTSIKMNNIARILILADISSHIITFFFTEISDTAHPCTKRPQWRHTRFSYQISVLIQDVFRLTEEYEQIQVFVAHKHFVQPDISSTEITSDRCGSMHEHTISPIAHKERNGLVHLVCFRTLWVCNKQIYFLPHFVQPCSRLATAKNHLICSQSKHGIDTTSIVASPFNETERGILHLRRISITQSNGLT